MNLAMGLERSEFLGAEPYERTSQRRGHANGYKDMDRHACGRAYRLKIPQVRGLSFYPQSLEKGCRSEKALKLAIAEMYVMGVSTRKVRKSPSSCVARRSPPARSHGSPPCWMRSWRSSVAGR